jgi:hypothetical protein
VAAAALTIWAPQISETNTLDLISRDYVADRAQVLVRREQKLQAITPQVARRMSECRLDSGRPPPPSCLSLHPKKAADFSAALFVSGFGRFPQ